MNAQSAADFLPGFLEHVVAPDPAYYRKIALLARDAGDQRNILLFDLCRASYAVRGTRRCRGEMDRAAEYTFKGNTAAGVSRSLFTTYIESPKQRAWSMARFGSSAARRILALGSIAEYGLLKLFWSCGIRNIHHRSAPGQPWSPASRHNAKWVLNYARHGQTLGRWIANSDWWVIEGVLDGIPRRWHLLPVLHPARNAGDPDYAGTRRVLRLM